MFPPLFTMPVPMTLLRLLDWLLVPAVLFTFYLYRRSKQSSLDLNKVPGPKSNSFLFGNLSELLSSQVGQTDFQWHAEYGRVVRVPAPLNEHLLLVADPKALHHVFQASGYGYPRQFTRRLLGRAFNGKGLTTVEGDVHRRQRRVMQPSFGASESRALLPIFFACAAKMSEKWTELISASPEGSVVVDLPSWISRTALDAIGLAAFDYEFGALDNADNELTAVYKNLFRDVFGKPSKMNVLAMSVLKYLPEPVLERFFKEGNSHRLRRLRISRQLGAAVAKKLVKQKTEALEAGHVNKDVMSSIVKANNSENPRTQLSEEEMYSLMQLLLIAGHETTANSFGWTVVELSKHQEAQNKLREEIRLMQQKIRERGDAEFTAQDLDSMSYLNCVVKEVFRFHPAVSMIHREASTDDILPLSQPIVSTTGEVLQELPIPKGTKITASIATYNRLPEVFGADADTFNPDRWLRIEDTKKGTSIGVYANLFTFSGGNRSCIGWRFAVLELQAIIVNIFGNFELSLAVPADKIVRENCGVMVPTIEGEIEKGCQLPVRVKPASASRED